MTAYRAQFFIRLELSESTTQSHGNLVGFVNKGCKEGAVNGECLKTGIYLPSGKMGF